jgi:rRNA maturation endonuclease Nob1
MVLWGLLSEKREEIVPEDPNMKFCWYCLREIPIDAEVCAYCGLRQEPLKRQ